MLFNFNELGFRFVTDISSQKTEALMVVCYRIISLF